ncbi:insulinase family protein [Priestia megaterium]
MIKRYTCKNGVRIVLENIPTVRSVAIGVWIGTGSRSEHPEINGVSHFLEHMFLKEQKQDLLVKLQKASTALADK